MNQAGAKTYPVPSSRRPLSTDSGGLGTPLPVDGDAVFKNTSHYNQEFFFVNKMADMC
jgi:hypothetical protein